MVDWLIQKEGGRGPDNVQIPTGHDNDINGDNDSDNDGDNECDDSDDEEKKSGKKKNDRNAEPHHV